MRKRRFTYLLSAERYVPGYAWFQTHPGIFLRMSSFKLAWSSWQAKFMPSYLLDIPGIMAKQETVKSNWTCTCLPNRFLSYSAGLSFSLPDTFDLESFLKDPMLCRYEVVDSILSFSHIELRLKPKELLQHLVHLQAPIKIRQHDSVHIQKYIGLDGL